MSKQLFIIIFILLFKKKKIIKRMKSVMCFYFAKTSHKSNITGLKTAKSASVSTEKLYRKIFHNKQKQILCVFC